MSDSQPLSVRSMAALGPVRQPDRSQFSLLVRHFLERFFNHETASPEGDAKARLVLIAVATGIPGFVVALYLWPIYHPFIVWPPGHALNAGLRRIGSRSIITSSSSSILLSQWESSQYSSGTYFFPICSMYLYS